MASKLNVKQINLHHCKDATYLIENKQTKTTTNCFSTRAVDKQKCYPRLR